LLPASIFQRFPLWQLSLILFLGVSILIGTIFLVITTNAGFLTTPLGTLIVPNRDATSTLISTRPVSTSRVPPIVSTEPSPTQTGTPIGTPTSPELSSTAAETPSATPTGTPSSTLSSTLPPLSSPSPTQICTLPPGWVIYTVQSGDTLFMIGKATGTTIAQLQQANCLGTSTQIISGQKLFVPKLPEIPTATNPVETPFPSATFTSTPVAPTSTGISPPPSATTNPSPIPSATPTESANLTQPPPTVTPAPGT